MRILLINVDWPFYKGKDLFPLGIAYVAKAAMLSGNAKELRVIDLNVETRSDSSIAQVAKNYDLVGLSFTTPSATRAKRLAALIKHSNPECLVIGGGIHASFLAESCLDWFDLVMKGEGEVTFINLLNKIEEIKEDWKQLSTIKGIAFKLENKYIDTGWSEPVDINWIDRPAYQFFDLDKYNIMSVISSRGCSYNCIYCAAQRFWRGLRLRKPELVVKELSWLAERGKKLIKFHDSTFTLVRSHAIKVCNLIKKEMLDLKWSCETRAENLDKELVKSMRDAGCIKACIGVDSGSTKILNTCKRNVNLSKLKTSIKNLKEAGIKVRIYLIFGLPGENETTVKETLNLIKQLQPNEVMLSLATAYPGTQLWDDLSQGHATALDADESWLKQFTGHALGAPIYLPKTLTKQAYMKLASWLRQELKQMRKRLMRKN